MLEIVFTDSACGALKMAQSFGEGEFHGGCIGIFVSHGDGSEPTPEEIEAETRKAEEDQRKKWETAVPLGGRACDVYGFSLGLSFGDIQEPMSAQARLDAFKTLFSFWNSEIEQDMIQELSRYAADLETVRSRIAGGEDARIWYSDIPDELCGFYWLMDQLRNLPLGHGTIYAIKQPKLEESDNAIRCLHGWGEIEPGQFHKYTHLAIPISDFLCRYYGNIWK